MSTLTIDEEEHSKSLHEKAGAIWQNYRLSFPITNIRWGIN